MTKQVKYKETGLEWCPQIPEHWEIRKLKYEVFVNPTVKKYDLSNKNDEVPFLPMEKVSEKGSITQDLRKAMSDVEKGFTYFEKDDIILAKITPCFENGKSAYLSNLESLFGFGSTEFHVLRAKHHSYMPFLFYLIRSKTFMKLGEANMSGSAGQKRIPTEFIREYLVGVPSPVEQQKIADYLDNKTTQIDSIIVKKEKQIELYKEERTAIINHAVTKGLNPDAKMKDSGIEWLGEIPEHWKIKKIGLGFSRIGSGTTPSAGNSLYYENGIHNWLQTGDLTNGVIVSTSKRLTDKALEDYSTLRFYQKGSLVIAMYGATIGKVGILDIETTTNQACCVLSSSDSWIIRYVYYWFIVNKEHIVRLSYGGGQPNISQEVIRNLRLTLPLISEQQEIVFFLDQETKRIDTLIEKTIKQIDLLKEYKEALINEVVTGQKLIS